LFSRGEKFQRSWAAPGAVTNYLDNRKVLGILDFPGFWLLGFVKSFRFIRIRIFDPSGSLAFIHQGGVTWSR
jgi:hypothetical protein